MKSKTWIVIFVAFWATGASSETLKDIQILMNEPLTAFDIGMERIEEHLNEKLLSVLDSRMCNTRGRLKNPESLVSTFFVEETNEIQIRIHPKYEEVVNDRNIAIQIVHCYKEKFDFLNKNYVGDPKWQYQHLFRIGAYPKPYVREINWDAITDQMCFSIWLSYWDGMNAKTYGIEFNLYGENEKIWKDE